MNLLRASSGSLALIICFGASAADTEATKIVMGDGQIDGTVIAPYEAQWRQCKKQDDAWVSNGSVIERATEIERNGRSIMRLEQETHLPNGVRARSVTLFDRATLAPLSVESRARNQGDETLGSASYKYEENGYTGSRARGDQQQTVMGEASSRMYRGMNLGLALATLDPSAQLPAELSASMVAMNATYDVIVTYAGTDTFDFEGKKVEAWMADIEWHHLGLGDVYPPGPDASGGRYWIVSDPPEGFPYVPRYQTDTFVVEFQPGVCQ
jgi:hypothetical protein